MCVCVCVCVCTHSNRCIPSHKSNLRGHPSPASRLFSMNIAMSAAHHVGMANRHRTPPKQATARHNSVPHFTGEGRKEERREMEGEEWKRRVG